MAKKNVTKKNNSDPKKLCFISHSSLDNENKQIAKRLQVILEKHKYAVFCSSVPKRGIAFGKRLFQEMNSNLKRCDYFIAVITDNYIRSPYCLYELCIARFLNLNIIPVLSSIQVEHRIKALLNQDIVNLIARPLDEDNMANTEKLLSNLRIKGDYQHVFQDILKDISTITKSEKPYIGMTDAEYKNILSYCNAEGIVKLERGQVYDPKIMGKKIVSAQCVYIVSTTGAGLLKSLKEMAIPIALRNGVDFNIIIPDKGSSFCEDVAMAECKRKNYTSVIEIQNKNRIEQEFEATYQYLNEAYCQALTMNENIPPKGKIRCFNSRTLLRQTLLLAVYPDNRAWGWLTMTMPPVRTANSPSIAIDDDNCYTGLGKFIIDHCKCLMQLAEQNHEVQLVQGDTSATAFCDIKKINAETYWRNKKDYAETYTKEKSSRYSKVLVEIAAQHPLYEGLYPNQEFKKRLDYALLLIKQWTDKEVWIYVPGSRHSYNGIDDKISLSQAGRDYLIANGMDESRILWEDANLKYKGDDGVFNSADECYVASQIFKTEDFGKLVCVCSSNQVMRKTFNYIEFGVIPECYCVSCDNMFHDVVTEYFGSLHNTIYDDHDWQSRDSDPFLSSRSERDPRNNQ